MTTVKEVNSFVNAFLNSHSEETGEDIKTEWASSANQAKLKTLLVGRGAGKRKKDPNAPKRGRTSYLFFCEAMRETVKAENPTMDAKEVTSELGARWNALKANKPKEVAKYVKLAEADKARYEEEKSSYVPPPETFSPGNGRSSKRPKDPNAPKRPKSGYLFFCQATRPLITQEQPDLGAKDVTTELGVRWNALKANKPKEVAKYEKLAKADKERYDEEKAAYDSSKGVAAAPSSSEVEEEVEEEVVAKKAKAKPAAAKKKAAPKKARK